MKINPFSIPLNSTSRTAGSKFIHSFVPKYNPPLKSEIEALEQFIENAKRILVVTGAGISTESGIPDYRSEGVGLYARTNHKPVQYQDFLKSSTIRQRYWARNYIGWPKFSQTRPNATHHALRRLEENGKLTSIITQNVDNLHSKAGSKNVVELHGTAFKVICLNCKTVYHRDFIQERIQQLNPEFSQIAPEMVRPDGDVEISPAIVETFKPPVCDKCHHRGVLKPDITFFGDNVPKQRVDLVKSLVSGSDAVLVLGSSLATFSGYRIILQAVEENKAVGIVNIGPTRADQHARFKIAAKCGDILPEVCHLR